jgi:uncharacterized membrane protein HdeD (DUF308 family)
MAAQPERVPITDLTAVPLSESSHRPPVKWARLLVPAVRGLLALALGMGILIGGDRALNMLGNFFGLYLLSDGIASLRSRRAGEGASADTSVLPVAAACLGILTGIMAVGRVPLDNVMPRGQTLELIATLALLTGWTQIMGLLNRSSHSLNAASSRLELAENGLLGGFEMLLGCLLLFAPTLGADAPLEPGLKLVLVGWAFVAAATLFTDVWLLGSAMLRASRPIGDR